MSFKSTLPPRQVHMDRVRQALSGEAVLSLEELRRATGLSLTQVKSALDGLGPAVVFGRDGTGPMKARLAETVPGTDL